MSEQLQTKFHKQSLSSMWQRMRKRKQENKMSEKKKRKEINTDRARKK